MQKNTPTLLAMSIAMGMRWCNRAHCPMEHIPGFTRSHWMLPLGKCLRCIAPAAAIVDEYIENTQNTNKKLFLASNYGTNLSLVVYENFIPQKGPSTQLINATSCVKIAMLRLELEISRSFLAIKHCQRTKIRKVIKQSRSSLKTMAHMCAISG